LAAAESSLPAQRPDEEEQQPRQQKQADWRPKRLVRTVLSSEADSKPFGRQMAREAKQRRFYEALCRASWETGRPGTGRSGSSTFRLSHRSWISSTC